MTAPGPATETGPATSPTTEPRQGGTAGHPAGSGLPPVLRGSRAAFVFLTRIPVGGFPYRREDWRWASAWFPFVGAALGALLAGLWWIVAPAGGLVAAAVVVACSMLLTGGFHEDGLADTADALGGAYDRDRVLEILKDSRIGAFGAMALVAALGIRITTLAALAPIAPLALLVGQCVSRWPPVVLLTAMPYATRDAASKSRQVTRATLGVAVLATVWPLGLLGGTLAAGWLSPVEASLLGAAAVLSAALAGWRFWRRVGGVTGDFLGATQQVVECVLLVTWAVMRGSA